MGEINQALKVSGLMKRWQCSRKSVLDAIKAGRLKAFKVGHAHWRISLDEVARYENDHQSSQEAS
jgi:excisionase family DNA binding protein